MKIKAIYEKKEDIPEAFAELYEERDGKFVLVNIEGIQTDANVQRLEKALRDEREDHKKTKDKLRSYTSLGDDPEEIHKKLDKIPELEAAAAGKIDEAKLEQMVEGRVKSRLSPVERERDRLKTELDTATGKITELDGTIKKSKITEAIRKAAEEHHVVPEAIDDAIMHGERIFEVTEDGKVVAKDNVGVSPGLHPKDWLSDMQKTRPHWWPASQGAGSKGGKGGLDTGDNPWSHDGWNLTKQGQVLNQDRSRAEALAKAAGVSVTGGVRPPKKAA